MSRQPVDKQQGLFLLNKPLCWSSAYAARWVGHKYGNKKAGHAGTLDPAASGLLVIGIGEGTKVLRYLSGADKCYHACVRMGTRTTTDDREGEVVETRPCPPLDVGRLRTVLRSFVGAGEQVPPMYSALKHQGKPLYAFARRQQTVSRPPRPIVLHSLELTQVGDDSFCFAVRCSAGTYIRVLARQLGEALGSVAHLSALCRVASGHFMLADALTPAHAGQEHVNLLPPDGGLTDMPDVHLTALQARQVRQGRRIDDPANVGAGASHSERWRAYDEQRTFIGVLERTSSGQLKPERIFNL